MATQIQVRKLKRKDRKTLGNLLVKFVNKTDKDKQSLINMIPSPSEDSAESDPDNEKSRNAEILEFAFSLIQGFIEIIEEDITVWFMDLIGVESLEEYDNLSIDVETEILNQIMDDKGFISFFLKGSQVRNKIKNLANPSNS